jgi:hypothetical protein
MSLVQATRQPVQPNISSLVLAFRQALVKQARDGIVNGLTALAVGFCAQCLLVLRQSLVFLSQP